jgi:hypothetical protein
MATALRIVAGILFLLAPKILAWLFTTIRREVVGLWLDYDQHRRMKNARDEA